MNKQYVEDIQKWKKAYLISKSKNNHMTLSLPVSVRDKSLLFKEEMQKILRMDFWTVMCHSMNDPMAMLILLEFRFLPFNI